MSALYAQKHLPGQAPWEKPLSHLSQRLDRKLSRQCLCTRRIYAHSPHSARAVQQSHSCQAQLRLQCPMNTDEAPQLASYCHIPNKSQRQARPPVQPLRAPSSFGGPDVPCSVRVDSSCTGRPAAACKMYTWRWLTEDKALGWERHAAQHRTATQTTTHLIVCLAPDPHCTARNHGTPSATAKTSSPWKHQAAQSNHSPHPHLVVNNSWRHPESYRVAI